MYLPVIQIKQTVDTTQVHSQFTSTQTNQNWAQFQKAQLTPYKTMYAFSCSPPGQGVMPTNLLPVIAPRMEPS